MGPTGGLDNRENLPLGNADRSFKVTLKAIDKSPGNWGEKKTEKLSSAEKVCPLGNKVAI